MKYYNIMKNTQLTTILFLFFIATNAQIVNTAPYILTISEAKQWTTTGATASTDLIATVPLANRFENTDTQFNPLLSNQMKIAYLPDGMNNFGNYFGEQSQFNLYNFTHWQYIDKLVWFGGTASQTLQLPSSPWVNAAHKNGVKVLGNVFFAPNVYGGSTATLTTFLEQDTSGNFIIIPKMIQMMQYYNFDGWFINEETGTNAATAQLMYAFVRNLTAQAELVGKEVIWYDSMIINGSISYRNRLDTNNSVFFQNDQDANTSNGFETKVSSSIFINFFWNGTTYPNASRNRANLIGRSTYDVFTGVDIWPGRNQADFETGGNSWMGYLFDATNVPYTSLGFFAPNCLYNSSQYSNFNNDANDYDAFFGSERHLFSGFDRNPQTSDLTGFKGVCNWVPETSSIMNFPFESNFCTGNGLKKFVDGVQVSANSWHNMNNQDILPTWQFAFSQNNILAANWDFNDAYNLGSSIKVTGNVPATNAVDLMLYKTKLMATNDTKIDVAYKSIFDMQYTAKLLIVFNNEPNVKYEFDINDVSSVDWTLKTIDLSAYSGREIASIGIRFNSTVALNNFVFNLGKIKAYNLPNLNSNTFSQNNNSIIVSYPESNKIDFTINIANTKFVAYTIYDIGGKFISSNKIELDNNNKFALSTNNLISGNYLISFSSLDKKIVTKKIMVK